MTKSPILSNAESDQRTCRAGEKCHWPGGPRQPLHRFTVTYYGVIHEYEYCVSCRAHKVRQVMASRVRLAKPDKSPVRVKPKVDDTLPSNAAISPAEQAATNRHLGGLIIRGTSRPQWLTELINDGQESIHFRGENNHSLARV